MKINTKVRYGLRTLMEIGTGNSKTGILQKDIALNQQISEKYLDHIVSGLKAAGLIVNAGGKKSGYILNRSKSKITLLDIYKAFESEPAIVQCINNVKCCARINSCSPREIWTELNEEVISFMKKTTLSQIIKRQKKLDS